MGMEEWMADFRWEHATALVVSLWLIAMLCLAFLYYKKRKGVRAWSNAPKWPNSSISEVTEPQMGYPITRGVEGWQSCQEELAEIDALLKRSEGADLQEFEPAELSSSKDDDPWAGHMADEVVPHHYYRAPGVRASE